MTAPWTDARSILAVRLDAMGDVLMTGPALRALASRSASITLLTSPAGAQAARLMPAVADVIEYEAPWMKATSPSGPQPDAAMIGTLASRAFDAAVIFTVHSQSALPAALLCHLAGIPLRAAHCRENPYQLLTDWIRELEPDVPMRHEVERQLALVIELGFEVHDDRLRLDVPAHVRRSADQLLVELGIEPHQPWAVMHPGASAPSRRYPVERYAAAAQQLVRDHGWRLVVAGGREDVAAADEIARVAGEGAVSLAGCLDLPGLAALVGRAPLFIGNNSGPAHVAAAVATPSVILYALTNPQHTPWRVPSRVLSNDVPCRNCHRSICPMAHHACLRGVSAERLVDAALELTGERLPLTA